MSTSSTPGSISTRSPEASDQNRFRLCLNSYDEPRSTLVSHRRSTWVRCGGLSRSLVDGHRTEQRRRFGTRGPRGAQTPLGGEGNSRPQQQNAQLCGWLTQRRPAVPRTRSPHLRSIQASPSHRSIPEVPKSTSTNSSPATSPTDNRWASASGDRRGTIATGSAAITGSRSMPSIGCTAMTNPTSACPEPTTSYCSAKVTSEKQTSSPGCAVKSASRTSPHRSQMPNPNTANDR